MYSISWVVSTCIIFMYMHTCTCTCIIFMYMYMYIHVHVCIIIYFYFQVVNCLGMYSSPSSIYHLFSFDYARVLRNKKENVITAGNN